MKWGEVLKYSLLLFVTAAILVLSVRVFLIHGGDTAVPTSDGVIALYLHGKQRCPDCLAMEAAVRRVVNEQFPKEIEQGRLIFRTGDYEEPEYAALAKRLKVAARSVVLIKISSEKLSDIREFGNDKEAYEQCLANDINRALAQTAGPRLTGPADSPVDDGTQVEDTEAEEHIPDFEMPLPGQ